MTSIGPVESDAVGATDLRVSIAPIWSQVRKLRADVTQALSPYPTELTSGVTMAASELIENAIKYGESIEAVPDILFSLEFGDDAIRIQTVNGSTHLGQVERLLRVIDEVARAEDTEALYIARLEELLADPGDSGKLGLYRVAFEGECHLECTYHDNIVTVTATRKLPMAEWNYEQDGLLISAVKTGLKALVTWKGVSDSRNPSSFLNPLVDELAKNLAGAEVTVDFTKLEYMNSATVGPLVHLIRQLDKNGKPVLVLFSDADWQRTHLKCMSAIARTLTHVRIEGRTPL